jgi:endonuclease YncB( thermonuclease family)
MILANAAPVLLAPVALSLIAATAVSAAELTGQASVVDGDTIEIRSAKIRIWGIDAPESDQTCRDKDSRQYRCGQKAANRLDAMISPNGGRRGGVRVGRVAK